MGLKQRESDSLPEPRSVFLEVFGDTPLLRLLDFLVVCDDFDYSMTDIARLSGVNYMTLRKLWPQLERTGMVVMTRKVGKAKMYTYDRKSPIGQRFKRFFWDLTKAEVRRKLQGVTAGA